MKMFAIQVELLHMSVQNEWKPCNGFEERNNINETRQSHNKSVRLAAEVGDGDNDNSHNQTVQGESLSENQHQNHTDEDLLLLTTSANTSISSNTNGQTSSQARQTAAKTGSQVTKTVEARVVGSLGGRSLN